MFVKNVNKYTQINVGNCDQNGPYDTEPHSKLLHGDRSTVQLEKYVYKHWCGWLRSLLVGYFLR